MSKLFDFKKEYYGLTDSEVEKNIALYGLNAYNDNEEAPKRSPVRAALLSPPFILMLVTGVLTLFTTGGVGTGVLILLLDALYAVAETLLRRHADKVIEKNAAATVTKFRVIRNGEPELIEKEYIVPDDTIVVQEGERVPADAFILESRDLTVDESVLTDSSKPAPKYAGAISKSEYKPTFVYSGTTVLTGTAVCRVTATGVDTKLYHKKGKPAAKPRDCTALEKIVDNAALICGALGAVMAAVIAVVRVLGGMEPIDSAVAGLTVGLCFIPMGISSIVRLCYANGMKELEDAGAVVKSPDVIEKLNSLNVLCVEKEGAISKNRVEVRGIYAKSEALLYKVAALAFGENSTIPAERALMVKAAFFDEKITDIYEEHELVERIPDSNEIVKGALWNVNGSRLYCIKGSPEQILPLCKLGGSELFAARKKCTEYYSNGCEVIAIACADAERDVTDSTAGFSYTFVGFAAVASPLRESVASAVKTCRRSGVRVVMFTEEPPEVAEATSRIIGLSGKGAVTGKQIASALKYGGKLDLGGDTFARLDHEQKLYVMNRLREEGEVVAMTGTRPNEADELNAADIGITIAQSSCGSTYEAADIIMNDDNFSSIANAIAAARRVHRSIKNVTAAMLSGTLALVILSLINIIGGAQLALVPAIVVLAALIPVPLSALCCLGCRVDTRSEMPPSAFVSSRKINPRFIGNIAVAGALCGGISVISYLINNTSGAEYGRSCAFITFAVCTAVLGILRIASDDPLKVFSGAKPLFYAALCVTLLLPILAVYIPPLATICGLCAIGALPLIISVILGILPSVAYFFAAKILTP